MKTIKKILSAIFLALIIALPLVFLETLVVYHLINLFEIPYLVNTEYIHILGIGFIMMIMKNRIRLADNNEDFGTFFKAIGKPTLNRIFRIVFIWVVAITIHTYHIYLF